MVGACNLDVGANIFLGREIKKRHLGALVQTLNDKLMLTESRHTLESLQIVFRPFGACGGGIFGGEEGSPGPYRVNPSTAALTKIGNSSENYEDTGSTTGLYEFGKDSNLYSAISGRWWRLTGRIRAEALTPALTSSLRSIRRKLRRPPHRL